MIAKLRLLFTITIVFLSFYGSAQTGYWKKTDLKPTAKAYSKQTFGVDKAIAFSLNEARFKAVLHSNNGKIMYFPDEHGQQVGYVVEETALFSKELAQKYPAIKSYKGVAVNNPKKQIRFSVSHKGVQSMVQEVGKSGFLFMQKTNKGDYILYRRSQQTKKELAFMCKTAAKTAADISQQQTAKLIDDQQLRIFRVAIAASGEYTQFHGGTKADALAAINATLTRVNGVLERDLAIRLELIGSTDAVIYTDPETDPFTGSLSSQAQSTFTSVIGAANYDIGHLFNQKDDTLDGNAGFIGAVCKDNQKGSGYTTLGTPVGDTFDIDLVVHEIGHQLGASHTFSHISEGTNVQVEPASGTTIMGYAGITGVNNVAQNSDDYFHYVSIKEIKEFLNTVSCGQIETLTNTPPTLVPLLDYTIPKGTAFVLSADAADADADAITYAWEQIDVGVVTQATFGPNNPVGANFRSLPPTTDSKRYFPRLERILNGQLTQTAPNSGDAWETVSDVRRTLTFSMTVRDNAPGGAQLVSDEMTIDVTNEAGPFLITSQKNAVSYTAGTIQTIQWDVANTNNDIIGANNVDILLSTDGGLTFDTTLVANTPNDGSQEIIMPSIATNLGRIMIKPSNGIFFAINEANFTIVPSEIILNFEEVRVEVCKPNDISQTFTYETYLGFNDEVTFSTGILPTGLNAQFSPVSATATNTPVTINFTGVTNLEEGIYPIQVLATSASITKDITINLHVFDAAFELVNLVSPANNFLGASTALVLEWEDAIENTSYDVELATTPDFSTIIESATVTANTYAPTLLENNTTYYWRVKPKNNCGEGVFSNSFSFTTIQFNCVTKNATGLPLEIPNSGTSVVRSKIVFYEDLPVADINVSIDVNHTFLEDLQISLQSPAGTIVTLISGSCGEFDDVVATFDDDADPFICGGNPSISGTVRPLGSLSSFNGESILGEWILEIRDNITADGGALNAFSLEVCVEGDFRPDADKDGVFDDTDDLCLDTPEGQEVNLNGCSVYRFPSENFVIDLASESCRENNDAAIHIEAKLSLDYQVSITGNGVEINQGFTNNLLLSNLEAGTYSVCITGANDTISYEPYCLDVVLTEPEVLQVGSTVSLDNSFVTLTLEGSDLYTIVFNEQTIQTTTNSVQFPLEKGVNLLKVYTNKSCQGVYSEQLVYITEPIVYPNPVIDFAEIMLGFNEEAIRAQIFNADGRHLSTREYSAASGTIAIDFSTFASGLYYVKLKGSTMQKIIKVIKK